MDVAKKFTNMNMEEEQLEEWAFYESGLVAHGCLENIDEYMREAITRYGRLLLSKQKIKEDIVSNHTSTNEPAWKSWDWPMYTPFIPKNETQSYE